MHTATAPAGYQWGRRTTGALHILGAIAEFERARIAERVRAGIARAKAQGRRVGRPPREANFKTVENLLPLAPKADASLSVRVLPAYNRTGRAGCVPALGAGGPGSKSRRPDQYHSKNPAKPLDDNHLGAGARITSSGGLSPDDPVFPPVPPRKPAPKPAPDVWNGNVGRTKAADDLERSWLARLRLQCRDAGEDHRGFVRKLGHERQPPA